jgi:hypothetical protein
MSDPVVIIEIGPKGDLLSNPLTVGQLIEKLKFYKKSLPVYFNTWNDKLYSVSDICSLNTQHRKDEPKSNYICLS